MHAACYDQSYTGGQGAPKCAAAYNRGGQNCTKIHLYNILSNYADNRTEA